MNKVGIPNVGPNRTGIASSEEQAEAMVEATRMFAPSSTGTKFMDDTVRILYARGGSQGLGSVPPPVEPADPRAQSAVGIRPDRLTLLLDKLGERLAFERTGVRLYEALVSKHEAFGGYAGGPTRSELTKILDDEHRHFSILAELVDDLGGDCTAVTPSADVAGTMAMGIGKVLSDPRTTLLQGLEAILVAELADRDGWSMLVDLGRELLADDVVAELVSAEQTEVEHLARVRGWVRSAYESGQPKAAQ